MFSFLSISSITTLFWNLGKFAEFKVKTFFFLKMKCEHKNEQYPILYVLKYIRDWSGINNWYPCSNWSFALKKGVKTERVKILLKKKV